MKYKQFSNSLRIWKSLHKRLLGLKLKYEYPSISWMLADILDQFDFGTFETGMKKK